MLFRLFVFIVLAGVIGGSIVRWLRGSTRAIEGGEMNSDELRSLQRAARSRPALAEAIEVRGKIRSAVKAHPVSLEESSSLLSNVDEVVRQLSAQMDARARVQGALGEFNANQHTDELLATEKRLEATEDEDTRRALGAVAERLRTQAEHLGRLRKRQDVLESTERQMLVELKNVHLAILDGISSAAGLGNERVKQIRAGLQEASDTIVHQADAEEEIAALLRGESAGDVEGG